jgi:hypothetical protein
MTKHVPFRHLVFLPAGAAVTLLAIVVIAPPSARGGCSHLVTSQNDRVKLAYLIDPSIVDFSDIELGRIETPAIPPSRRPCSGAWCSGQPGAPAAPPKANDRHVDSWAWHRPTRGSPLVVAFFRSERNSPCPNYRRDAILRPPRFLPSA